MKVQSPKSNVRNAICVCASILSSVSLFAATNSESTNDLPKLSPPYAEIPPTFWEQHEVPIVLAGVVGLVLTGLVVWLRLRPKPRVMLPPAVQARKDLATLRQRPEDGAVLSCVSQILRRYFVSAFELPQGELTTAEFCRALATSETIGGELAAKAGDFLRRCDEQKFSPAKSAATLDAVNQAQSLVAAAETRHLQMTAQTHRHA